MPAMPPPYPLFERAVKILIRRLHPTVQGMDGSGGDGGVDMATSGDLARHGVAGGRRP
ncbi:hypothetical protein GCM10010149_37340 [Nonomuraea roseoviolacea subsp. roseoviolacea]